MSKFLKLKSKDGSRKLVSVDSIVAVHELGEGCEIETDTNSYTVKEGYQTLVNRLTKGDEAGE